MSDASKNTPNFIKLICASAAGICGTLVCYPLDVLRLNMQVAGELGRKRHDRTTIEFARTILERDGVRGLYQGLSASIARQGLYTGTRLGLYQILIDKYSVNGQPIGFLQKCLIGSVSGMCGAVVGLPPDVILTRMAVDNRLSAEKRRNYKHVFDGMIQISKNEGILTLYRGAVPTIARAVVVNISQVVSYFQTKEFLIKHEIVSGDTNTCQFLSSLISSAVATTCTLPIDITKTRIQNMKEGQYRNMLDVWYKILRYEGVFALWKGFTPMFIRNAPQFVVTFLAYEKFINLAKKIY